MATELGAEFEDALERRGVTWSRVESETFESAVRDAVVEPAVGASLPFEGVSLADTPVALRPTPRELREAETGVTAAQFGVSAYGSLLVQSDDEGTEQVSLYPARHVAVLRESDLVADVPSALDRLREEFRAGRDSAVFATGPSATGDMGALVEGVHGPREVHVILLSDR